MTAFSDYLEEELIKHIFRTGSFTKPTTLAVCLLTTVAVDTDSGQFTVGTGVEVANANGYSRQVLNPADANWSNPATGTQGETDNLSAITFGPASGGSWGTIVGVAVTDSVTHDAGNLLFHGTMTTSKTVDDGDTFTFSIGDLNFQLN